MAASSADDAAGTGSGKQALLTLNMGKFVASVVNVVVIVVVHIVVVIVIVYIAVVSVFIVQNNVTASSYVVFFLESVFMEMNRLSWR